MSTKFHPSLTVHEIATVLRYGTKWVKPDVDNLTVEESRWARAQLEAVGHIGACMLTQNYCEGGVPTGDVVQMIEDYPDFLTLRKRLEQYIKGRTK